MQFYKRKKYACLLSGKYFSLSVFT
uniref:Uncharacterized protein n=1 Tax=Anguilla anguilla TaxID=7936 RepID=A0A0E9XI59_ANGAN